MIATADLNHILLLYTTYSTLGTQRIRIYP